MLENGNIIAGRYEILEKIGTGGMSDVYKALDTTLSREVALKVLKDEYVTDMGFVSKFRAEAMSAAGLEHPNIVNIYDVGNEDGHYFIVMEYVEGITLKTYIAKKGHLSHNELLSIAIQVGRGIEAAHNKNIIHRDIKPQNIIISKEGKVKVTDFGIARAVTSNTINADRMGSVHYSSPEQARNGHATFQSDIYSLGIVMYEMCTGRVPFDGDTTVAVAIQHLQSEMTPPSQLAPDVPISVEKIILRATMKNPERRYYNMSEMLTDLKKALVNPLEDFVFIPPAAAVGTDIPVVSKEQQPVKTNTEPYHQTKSRKTSRVEPEYDPEDYDPDEDDDDEDGVSHKIDKAVTIMGIAAAIVIILIVIYILGSFFGFFGFNRKQPVVTTSSVSDELYKVPNVLGMTEKEAREAIEDKGFKYQKIGEASSDIYEEGQIMEQTPEGGELESEGSVIKVMVSSGIGDIPIPAVVGYTQEQAMSVIKDAEFKCVVETEYSSSIEQGEVIRQNPSGNEKGSKGDTVTIWVSRGKEVTNVPNVVGASQTDATNTLTSAGYKVNVKTEPSDTVAQGKVISQTPTGQAESGSTVTIIVSEGGKTYYSFLRLVAPINGEPTYVVLRDANGNELTHWLITTQSNIRASNLPVSSGVLVYYTENGATELDRENVTFTAQ